MVTPIVTDEQQDRQIILNLQASSKDHAEVHRYRINVKSALENKTARYLGKQPDSSSVCNHCADVNKLLSTAMKGVCLLHEVTELLDIDSSTH